jgi:hypothetical protein
VFEVKKGEEMKMANLVRILKQLQGERSRTQKELSRLDGAIAAFERLVGRARKSRARRKLSAAARLRIARAQQARWRKVRKAQRAERTRGKVRTMSAAARKRISEAQKNRWAKIHQKAA